MKVIEWETLSAAERAALCAAGETSPLAFTSLWFNLTQGEPFICNWHHHYFDYAARKMLSGECKNVIINIPPGGTKTEFWSVGLPAFACTTYDKVRILNASFSKSLAEENSCRARDLIGSAEYSEMYRDRIIAKNRVDDWTLNNPQGKRTHQLFSRSSGGQITGVRGGYISDEYTGHVAADDWDKPDDMFSDVRREKSRGRLTNTVRSRRATSDTPFIFVQQRLHTDDSTAYLLAGKMGLKIDLHIKIPSLVDQDYIDNLPDGIREACIRDVCGSKQINGKWSYWPRKESVDSLVDLMNANPYTFSSQYQQEPEGLEGEIFNPDDFLYYGDVGDGSGDGADVPPPDIVEWRFITADTAQKTNTWNDYTVFCEWGVAQGRIYLLSMLRDRMDAKKLRREFTSFVRSAHAKNGGRTGVLRKILVEDKSSGTGLIQELEGKLPLRITPVQRATDKTTRALDVQGHHAQKKVVLPYGDKDNFEFVAEVGKFRSDDSHKFDDQVDNMIDALYEVYVAPSIGKSEAGTW